MKSIDSKCRKCDKLKEFLSYDGTSKMKIHIVCYDKDIHHYELFPRFTLIPLLGKKQINYRLRFTGLISIILMLLSIAFITITTLLKSFLLLIVGVALLIMALYTFLQLHFIDLKLIRVFEVVFDNETYWNLENMDVNNVSNRVQEIYLQPEKGLDNTGHLHIPVLSELVLIIKFSIKLIKRDLIIKYYMHHIKQSDENSPDKLLEQINLGLKEITEEMRQSGLEMLGFVFVKV